LRRGAHSGNQFRIVVRVATDTKGSIVGDPVSKMIETIGEQGVPNYFGEQRFGRDNNNLQLAERLFAGKRLNRDKRSFALSSARAWLFNHVLQNRVETESWSVIHVGDIAALDGSSSIFTVEEADETITRRCQELDLHPTGPLWGESSNHNEVELNLVGAFPTLAAGLEKQTKASRRPLRLAVRELKAEPGDGELVLQFHLARGSFATAVLREIVDYGI
jgi:tRNA pseudouridine13 synthase